MRALHVIILAAGGGTRMKSELPKVLHPICGRPMISYALDLAAATGGKQPVIVLGESAEQIQPHLPKEIKVVIQPKPLGTGDAVLAAKRAVGTTGDVLILYADTPLLRRTTVQRLIETHFKSNATCTLLTTHLADPSGYGRILRETNGTIVGVIEESDANAQQRTIREINTGPLCVKAEALFQALANVKPSAVKKEWYLTHAIGLIGQQEGAKFQSARVEEATEAFGVNSQTDLARSAAIIRQRIVESHLNNGVMIVDPEATYIDHGVSIGHDTTIHPGTVIASGVSIGRRCSIGPYARLRPGVAVGDDARIGNFVELVRTKVGARVRIQHMSYLGDTVIEDEVNIGAGTITANFNGTQKCVTEIGKGAFIGCDTVLIAPVKVGPGAVTGAGSVIPKGHDVPPRGVVVGVPARVVAKAAAKASTATQTDGHKPAAAARASAKVSARTRGRAVATRRRVVAKRAAVKRARRVVARRPSKRPVKKKALAKKKR